ncbi:hypothetical protein [Pseudaquabacterium terrae]|nr:hypothetical protein [Aquabacterium terrae]
MSATPSIAEALKFWIDLSLEHNAPLPVAKQKKKRVSRGTA